MDGERESGLGCLGFVFVGTLAFIIGLPALVFASSSMGFAPVTEASVASAPVLPAGADAQSRFAALKPAFQRAEAETGVPWQVQAAQWAVETAWGTATPKDMSTGQESYNLFGIKGTGPAGSVVAMTTEVEGGREVRQAATFRAYHSYDESIADHARLLTTRHYAPAFSAGRDLQAWVRALQELGYATDPNYAGKLWQVISSNGWDEPRNSRLVGR